VIFVRFPLPILFFKLFFSLIFLPFFPVFANGSCIIPGTDSSCNELVSELPWAFNIEQKEGTNRRISFASQEATKKGGVQLKMFLESSSYNSREATTDAFLQISNKAHPDMGITYGWDLILIQETRIYHLHADCTLSESNFMVMARALELIVSPSNNQKEPSLLCRCGGGCTKSSIADRIIHGK